MMVVRNSNETSTRKVQLLDIDDIPEGKAKRVEIEGNLFLIIYIFYWAHSFPSGVRRHSK